MNHAWTSLLLLTVSAAAQTPLLPVDEMGDMFSTKPPHGLPTTVPAPADNPLTKPAFELGRKLFFDPILSIDQTVACATCHLPEHGFSSPQQRPLGVHGKHALRHAPTLYNRGFGDRQRWDGSAATLEEQVLLPIQDPNEMALTLGEAVTRLRSHPTYPAAFAAALGGEVSERNLSRALSSFVRGLMLGDSPIDRFQSATDTGLSPAEKAGLWIYESKGNCWNCHSGANFTDERFHNTGVGVRGDQPEPGRFAVTGVEEDRGRFKTPTLRGLLRTAPYMHDGSLATIADVVDFYARGGHPNVALDPKIRPLQLSATDRQNLIAFLEALSRN